MAAVRAKDTGPERAVRGALHKAGYRFRLHRRDLPGSPDLVFPGRRKIIEVRGCFWHRHPDPSCKNAVLPRVRSEWWQHKLAANVARDARNDAQLAAMGWKVLVVWECEVSRMAELVERLVSFLNSDHLYCVNNGA